MNQRLTNEEPFAFVNNFNGLYNQLKMDLEQSASQQIAESGDLKLVGVKKEAEELHAEELWMKRIEILEDQYDQHLNLLQKKLLNTKINSRVLTSLKYQNEGLKADLINNKIRTSKLQKKMEGFQTKLRVKDSSEHKLRSDLNDMADKVKEMKLEIKRSRDLARKSERETELVKQRTFIGKKERSKMMAIADIQELDIGRARSEISAVGRQSEALAQSLMKAENEKRKLEKEVADAVDAKAFLCRKLETDEERMRGLQLQLDEILTQLKSREQQCSEISRQRELTEKNLVAFRDELKKVLGNVTLAALETKYWKEEAESLLKIAEAPAPPQRNLKVETKDRQEKRSETSLLQHRITTLERKLTQMEDEKMTLKSQMKSVLTLHKSFIGLYHKNSQKRKDIEEKLKADLPIERPCNRRKPKPSDLILEKQTNKLNVLEKELFRSKRAYNYLKFKLQEKYELERNLSIVEVKLHRTEREKRQSEAVANQLARKPTFPTSISNVQNTNSLTNSLISQIEYVRKLREKLASLLPKTVRQISQIPSVADIEGNMIAIKAELRKLERKQTVNINIQAEKERALDAKRLMEFNTEEESDAENYSEVADSLDTESEDEDVQQSSTESPTRPDSATKDYTANG